MTLRAATDAVIERVFAANTALLLSYAFAADHGGTLDLHDGPGLAGRIEVSFGDGSFRFDETAFVQRRARP